MLKFPYPVIRDCANTSPCADSSSSCGCSCDDECGCDVVETDEACRIQTIVIREVITNPLNDLRLQIRVGVTTVPEDIDPDEPLYWITDEVIQDIPIPGLIEDSAWLTLDGWEPPLTGSVTEDRTSYTLSYPSADVLRVTFDTGSSEGLKENQLIIIHYNQTAPTS